MLKERQEGALSNMGSQIRTRAVFLERKVTIWIKNLKNVHYRGPAITVMTVFLEPRHAVNDVCKIIWFSVLFVFFFFLTVSKCSKVGKWLNRTEIAKVPKGVPGESDQPAHWEKGMEPWEVHAVCGREEPGLS